MFALRTYIGGWHSDDDFEIAVKKVPTGATSSGVTRYRMRNVSMTSNVVSYLLRDVLHERAWEKVRRKPSEVRLR